MGEVDAGDAGVFRRAIHIGLSRRQPLFSAERVFEIFSTIG